MTDIQELENMKTLILIMSSVISVFLLIIGYFMSRRDKAITDATDNISDAVQQLKIVVNGLQSQYSIRQPIIDQQLELHRKQIELNVEKVDRIDNRLITLETEHKFGCVKQKMVKTVK